MENLLFWYSNRKNQDAIDALKLRLALEDEERKKSIIQTEIARLEAKQKKETKEHIILIIFIFCMLLVLYILGSRM